MTGKILKIILEICGPLSILSIFVIATYLYKNKVCTGWEIRTAFLWLQMIVDYKDHTKKNLGHVGIWFYVFIVNIILSLLSILALVMTNIIAHKV